MKALIVMLTAALGVLSGCVAYAPPYSNEPVYRAEGSRPGERDRDRDGIPNRADRDRDGDGVRNRNDSRPNNPGRY
jgi:hypothetical protein